MWRDHPIRSVGIHDWGTHPCPPGHLYDLLGAHDALDCSFEVTETDDLSPDDGVITVYHHDEFLESAEWVHNIRSGYEDFPLAAYEAPGVTMTNSTGIAGDLVAETVTGLVTSLAKGLHRYQDSVSIGCTMLRGSELR
jgi:D-2-hydroxyacid dehydrogenase (NADP+)